MKGILRKKELDEKAVDIEFLLISVIQGVALAALAASAVPVIGVFDIEHIFYVVSGFLFILIFWSAAVGHVLSFIDWPLDLIHNFLYLLASFIEVMAFSYLRDPLRWFIFISIFLGIIGILYMWDLRLIKKHKDSLAPKLYDDILKQQTYELMVLFPSGLLFSIAASLLLSLYPGVFLAGHYHIVLSIVQALVGLFVLFRSTKAFIRRSRLIEE